MNLKVKRLRKNAVVMKKATKGSAGLDLCACIDCDITLNPGERLCVPTGIAVSIESENYAAFVFARSGLGIKHGITLSNGVGVIDSDYRGEIAVGLVNLSDSPYTITPNERIAQMVIMPVEAVDIFEVDELDSTQRGSGGLGSTGTV